MHLCSAEEKKKKGLLCSSERAIARISKAFGKNEQSMKIM
jgi:hypothetical protein